MKKTKVSLIQLGFGLSQGSYKVVGLVRLVNRTDPKIDEILKESDVQTLIKQNEDLTVEIKPDKRKLK